MWTIVRVISFRFNLFEQNKINSNKTNNIQRILNELFLKKILVLII